MEVAGLEEDSADRFPLTEGGLELKGGLDGPQRPPLKTLAGSRNKALTRLKVPCTAMPNRRKGSKSSMVIYEGSRQKVQEAYQEPGRRCPWRLPGRATSIFVRDESLGISVLLNYNN